jgi:uncharacterized protein
MTPSVPIIINNQEIRQGEFREVYLNTYRLPSRTVIEIPVYVFRSATPGPKVLITSGLHGDEINGIEVVKTLLREKHFENLKKGSVIAIPIVNIVAFLNGSRELPDGKDLNRCFPGTSSGSMGSRIAYDLMTEIIPQINFGVDFHTGGKRINNYPQLRCVFSNAENLSLGKKFGAHFILNSPYREKTLRKEAGKLGKPILVYEAGESMRFNQLAVTEGVKGCLRLLKNTGMLDVAVEESKTKILSGSRWIRANVSGLFRTNKKYGSLVNKGEPIGSVSDPFGESESALYAPARGYIIGINNMPVVNEGDALIHIGIEKNA